jgi:formylglycine-generating enzyme required for sulfatase activity
MGTMPSSFKNCELCPVENVSWLDVQAFLNELNAKTGKKYRLPTEAEWEFAAKGGKKSNGYTYAGSASLDEVGWYDGNSGRRPQPVGQKKANELGLFDMSGNVWEWCQDGYGYYSNDQTNSSNVNSNSYKLNRGGGWYFSSRDCRSSRRNYYVLNVRSRNVGFRIAL